MAAGAAGGTDAIDRFVARVYRRHRTSYLALLYGSSVLWVLVGVVPGFLLLVDSFVGLSQADYLRSVAAFDAAVLVTALAMVPVVRGRMAPVRRWLRADPDADAATAWNALVVEFPLTISIMGVTLHLVALPAALYVAHLGGLSWAGALAVLLLFGAINTGTFQFAYLSSEPALWPVITEVGRALPEQTGTKRRSSYGTRILAACMVMNLFTGVVVAAAAAPRGGFETRMAATLVASLGVVGTLSLGLALALSRSLRVQLGRVGAALRKVEGGDYHTRLVPMTADEFDDVAHSFNAMARQFLEHEDDLRESGARVVTAADDQRRRSEEELAEGPLARLVELRSVLDDVARHAADADATAAPLDRAAAETASVLTWLRDFAHGMFPAALASDGLVVAIEEAASRSSVATTVRAAVDRVPAEVEIAAYFCCLEAIRHVERAGGERLSIVLAANHRQLEFEILSEGLVGPGSAFSVTGDMQPLTDRVGALGGTLRADVQPGIGPRLRGVLPLHPDDGVALAVDDEPSRGDLLDRWFDRLYERRRETYLQRVFAVGIALGLLAILPGLLALGGPFEHATGHQLAVALASVSVVLAFAIPLVIAILLRHLAPIRAWLGDPEASDPVEVWTLSAPEFPGLIVRVFGIAAACILVPAEVLHTVILRLSPLGTVLDLALFTTLAFTVMGAVAAFLDQSMSPVARDAARRLSGTPLSRRRLSFGRGLIGLLISINLYTALVVTGVSAAPDSVVARMFTVVLASAALTATVALAFAALAQRSLILRLLAIRDAMARVEAGDYRVQMLPVKGDELDDVAATFNAMARRLRGHDGDVRAAQARVIAASDTARRRIERALHDGAQQQLETLRDRVGLARDAVGDADRLRMLVLLARVNLDAAIDELTRLARGIYPATLTSRGLVAALEESIGSGPSPVYVESDHVGRYPREVESAVYFCCLEAVQNIAQHAGDGVSRSVLLTDRGGLLYFAVTDAGCGFDPDRVSVNRGLQNMADRIGALGGVLNIDSRPGAGTRVTGDVPARRLDSAVASAHR